MSQLVKIVGAVESWVSLERAVGRDRAWSVRCGSRDGDRKSVWVLIDGQVAVYASSDRLERAALTARIMFARYAVEATRDADLVPALEASIAALSQKAVR